MERHPVIVAGLGFRAEVQADALAALLAAAQPMPTHLAVLRQKSAASAAFQAFAAQAALPVIPLDEADILGQQTVTFSPRIMARFGTGSVAEALALVACRPAAPATERAQLITPRVIGADGTTTLALAERRPK